MRASYHLALVLLSCLFLTLLPLLALAQDGSDSEPAYTTHPPMRAQLIIHKRLITPIPGLFAAHRPINVSIICYNVGTLPAHSVTIGDNWGDLFDITEGTNVTEVDVLEVGAVAELNFTVVPSKEGYFTGGAATVSYQAEGEGSALQQAYSSGYRSFTIYNQDMYDQYSRSKWIEWTVLAVGLLGVVGIPLAIWAYIQLNYHHGVPKAKKAV